MAAAFADTANPESPSINRQNQAEIIGSPKAYYGTRRARFEPTQACDRRAPLTRTPQRAPSESTTESNASSSNFPSVILLGRLTAS